MQTLHKEVYDGPYWKRGLMAYYSLGILYIAGLGLSWHLWQIIRSHYIDAPFMTWRSSLKMIFWPIFGIDLFIRYLWDGLIDRLRSESVPITEQTFEGEIPEALLKAIMMAECGPEDDEDEDSNDKLRLH